MMQIYDILYDIKADASAWLIVLSLEEWFEYGADPFYFRVTVTGEWSDEVDDWAKKSIARVKNVRSVLDTIIFNSGGATIPLNVAAAVCGIEITDEVQML